jgi:hypothetical protein
MNRIHFQVSPFWAVTPCSHTTQMDTDVSKVLAFFNLTSRWLKIDRTCMDYTGRAPKIKCNIANFSHVCTPILKMGEADFS